MEQENQVRRGYPIWGWIIGGLFLFPLIPMLVGVTIPRTRRYLGAPGVIVSTAVIIVGVAVVGAACGDGESQNTFAPTRVPATPVPPTADPEAYKGFHCLSPWDGNHDGLERLVKRNLNDPDSMKTYETKIAPSGSYGQNDHAIRMQFGARNAFGGMVRHTAHGWVDHETCEAELLSIE